MSSAAVPPIRTRPISAARARRRRRRAPRSAHRAPRQRLRPRARGRRRASPSRARCRRRAAALRAARPPRVGVGHRVRLAAERRRISAASGPTVTSSSTPALAGVRADLAVQARRLGPELEHVAEHRHAPRGRRLGEVVERGAHRHRVGVVAVVDHDHSAGELDALAAQRREAHLQAALRGRPRAPARRPRRPAGCAGCAPAVKDGRRRRVLAAVARSISTSPSSLRRESGATSPPSPNVTVSQVGAQVRLPAAARRRAPRPSRPAPGRRSARPWPRRSPRASPSSSRCTGPTLTITPTSGSAIAVSSAICPAPRIAISSTSTSVSAGAAEHRQRQADLGVEVLRADDRAQPLRRSSAARMSFVEVLPVEPGDRDDLRAAPPSSRRQARASACRPPADRGARARAPRSGVRALRRRLGVLGRDEHAPGAGVAAPAAACSPPSARSPRRPTNSSPGRDLARVDRHAPRTWLARPRPARARRPRAARDRGDARGDPTASCCRDRAAERARSASRATATSSNGSLRPPANSWPCSWPLPAITSTSPRPRARSPDDRLARSAIERRSAISRHRAPRAAPADRARRRRP